MSTAASYQQATRNTVSQHIDRVVGDWKRSSDVQDPTIKKLVCNRISKELHITYRQAKQLVEA